jgi:hypothetical protein
VAIVGLGEGSLEWITPTLYLRGRENHLFELSNSPSQSVLETKVAEQSKQATAAVEARDPVTASPHHDGALANTPDDEVGRGRHRAMTAAGPSATWRETATVPAPDAHAPSYPDRLAELWAAAMRAGFGARPAQAHLRPLATALRPDEKIFGSVMISFISWTSFAATVTDQNVHLSTNSPGDRGWGQLARQLPKQYRPGNDRIRIPLDDVEGPVAIDGGNPIGAVLKIRGHSPVRFKFGLSERARLFQSYVAQAQYDDRRRSRH